MTRLTTARGLTDLAEVVVATGFEPQRDALARLASTARRLGVRPLLADVVTDPTTPRPVRERALGRLIVAMSAISADCDGLVAPGTASAA